MAKRRGEQKQVVKKRAAQREASITPAKWFNIIVTALLIGVILIVAFGYLKKYL
jgi:capsular polysaccharide biosynthesis protein